MNPTKRFSKITSAIFKNLLVFLVGGIIGILNALVFAKPLLAHTLKKDIGLGVIAAAPLLLLFYSVLSGLAGGILAVIVYHLVRFIKRKNKKRSV